MRKILAVWILLFAPCALATTRYVAQTAGTFSGGTACNSHTAITPATWNSTAESPGDISYLCGAITGSANTTALIFGWSGSSGNPLQLIFDTGASLESPYWAGGEYGAAGGAIQCINHNYITINGDVTGGRQGVIANTANGTGLANQQDSAGTMFYGCNNATIENLTVGPIYLSIDGDPNSTAVSVFFSNSDATVINNVGITYAYTPLNIGYASGAPITSAVVENSSIDYGCHLINVGDATTNASAAGVVISGNVVGPHTEAFNQSTGNCHQDGFLLQAENPGSTLHATIYNNWIKSDMCSNRGATGLNCTAPIFYSGGISSTVFFNNIIQYTQTAGGYEGMFVLRADQPQSGNSFYNNTIDQNNAGLGQSCTCSMVKMDGASNSQSGFIFKNNVFLNDGNHGVYYNNNSGSGSITFATLFAAGAVNNNNYYGIGGDFGFDNVNSQAYATFASWQTPQATNSFRGYDAGGSNGNPQMNGNYVPQAGSTAISLGANLTSLSISALDLDFSGNMRLATGNWTAGVNNANPPIPNPVVTPAAPALSGVPTPTGATAYTFTQTFSFPLEWMNPGLVWSGSVSKIMTFDCLCMQSTKTCSCTVN